MQDPTQQPPVFYRIDHSQFRLVQRHNVRPIRVRADPIGQAGDISGAPHGERNSLLATVDRPQRRTPPAREVDPIAKHN